MFNLSRKGQEIYQNCFPPDEKIKSQEFKNLNRTIKFSIPCPECQKLFQNRSILITHLESKHGVTCSKADLKLTCIQCEKKFGRHDHLTTHIESIHEGIKYDCTQCDKKFTQKGELNVMLKELMRDYGIFVTNVTCK